MATFVWTPRSYGSPPLRVRRNPNASVYEPVRVPDDWPSDTTYFPNGNVSLGDAASDAFAQLDAAGPRGAAALGALAGLLFSGWKAGVAGGLLGYFGGKYLVNLAGKAIAVTTAVNKVETAVAKATT